MGHYTDRLFSKNRVRRSPPHTRPVSTRYDTAGGIINPHNAPQEIHPRLIGCYIERDGVITEVKFGSHAEVRMKLGDSDPYTEKRTDQHGFVTSDGEYLNRHEANKVAARAGQCELMRRDMLSSDVHW